MVKKYHYLRIKSEEKIDELISHLFNIDEILGTHIINDNEIVIYTRSNRINIKPFKNLELEWGVIDEEGWLDTYRKSLKPRKIGKKLIVLPRADINEFKGVKRNKGKRKTIFLVPGKAFGTGEHFTTASILKALEEIKPFPKSVLDFGCGSGILAIGAKLLGAKEVFAFDNDLEACLSAKVNIKLNRVKIFLLCGEIYSVKKKFDLVMANLLYETIVENFNEIKRVTREGGFIILSGIIKDKKRKIKDFLKKEGVKIIKIFEEEEWLTLLTQK